MNFGSDISRSSTQNDIVTVKSNLILLAGDNDLTSKKGQKKPRKHLIVNRTPSFHIDPADAKSECCGATYSEIFYIIFKIICLPVLLYFFVTSLDLLATSFRLIGGRTASAVFQQSELLNNPVVGLMIGVLVTVIVQSSSTSSSIIVSMVAANFLDVQTAIPIIMGANVGTSVTNTFVSFGQISDRAQFERAFAGATVHDMFNWLCVLVLLPIEATTNYLYILTKAILSGINFEQQDTKIELLSKITKPFTNKIVKIDKKVLAGWSMQDENFANMTLLKIECSSEDSPDRIVCDHLAAYIGLSDLWTGILLLAISLITLCFCLIGIVKILSSFLKGSVAGVVEKVLNADLPYVPFLTGYIALGIGAIMTFLLQSSSIFTSSLTPLVGLGVISLERVYPLTLGSNIGTTTTALLAALTADANRLQPAIQIALVHMFFNITGILIFYPLPFMRFPIAMAKTLGKVTAKHRWFAIVYMLLCFLVMPIFVFVVSLGGTVAMYSIFTPVLLLTLFIILVNVIQNRNIDALPDVLQTWNWLPKCLRSLEPIEDAFSHLLCCKKSGGSVSYSPVVGVPSETMLNSVVVQ